MQVAQISLVNSKSPFVDFTSVDEGVTVRAEGNQVVVAISPALLDKHDVVNFNINVSALRNSAPMPRFDQNAPTYISGYYGPRAAQLLPPGNYQRLR